MEKNSNSTVTNFWPNRKFNHAKHLRCNIKFWSREMKTFHNLFVQSLTLKRSPILFLSIPLIHILWIIAKNIDFQVPKVAEIFVKKGEGGFYIFGDSSQLLWTFFPVYFWWLPLFMLTLSMTNIHTKWRNFADFYYLHFCSNPIFSVQKAYLISFIVRVKHMVLVLSSAIWISFFSKRLQYDLETETFYLKYI